MVDNVLQNEKLQRWIIIRAKIESENMANDTLEELQKAAQELRNGIKDVDGDIKKLTGRDPSETSRLGGNRRIQLKRNSFQRGNRQEEPLTKQRREIDGITSRRWGRTVQIGSRASIDREKGLHSSEEDDESSKPAIQSVVATDVKPVRLQSRPASDDRETKSRNRRMFGLLIGTLQKFKEDTRERTAGEKKRQEIEQKLEQKAEQEKQEVSNQRKELFQTRKQRQQELKSLERRMENVLLKEEIAAHNKELANFIILKSKPKIFYIPAKHNTTTKQLLDESKVLLKELQEKRFKDMDLDADDVGLNSWSNRQVNNGKKLIGRMIQEKDVSHKDLFEEETMHVEADREDGERKDSFDERRDEKSSISGADMINEGLSQVNEERRSMIEREERIEQKQRGMMSLEKENIKEGNKIENESLMQLGMVESMENEERNERSISREVSKDVQDFVSNNLNSLGTGYDMTTRDDEQMNYEEKDNQQEFHQHSGDTEGEDQDSLQEGKNITQYNIGKNVNIHDESIRDTVESNVHLLPDYQ